MKIAQLFVLAFLWGSPLAQAATAPSPGKPAPADDWAACSANDPATILSGCTNVLARNPPETAARRAAAFASRGKAKALQNDALGAIADFDQSIALDAANPLAWIERARSNIAFKNYPAAIADASQAMALDPGHYRAYYVRGVAREWSHDTQAAIADFDRAIILNANFAPAFLERGYSRVTLKDQGAAIPDFDRALALEPKNLAALLASGRARTALNDYAAALADFDQANAIDPKNTAVMDSRATARFWLGDIKAALADFDQILVLEPKNLRFLSDRAGFKYWTRNFEGALADLNLALAIEPANTGALVTRCAVKVDMGDVAGGLADAQAALGTDAKLQSGGYRCRGYARAAQGDTAAALADYSNAISLDTQSPFAYLRRGQLYLKIGRYQQSVDDFAQGAQISPYAKFFVEDQAKALAALAAARSPVTTPAALAHARVALVIGNSAYQSVPGLPNPRADAEAIAAALKAEGFAKVVLLADASRADMVKTLRAFGDEADKADWAMVYYAVHGMELNGNNYLIPVDAKLESERDLEFEAVPLRQVQDMISRASKLKLVLLDACRNNPFDAKMKRMGAQRAVVRGLAPAEPDDNTLVVYASKAGETADDGAGGHSPFAAALLKHLPERGVEINKLFRLVIDDVQQATARKQRPFVYGSVTGKEDFYFVAP